MSFWTEPSLEPTRKYRFRIYSPSSEDMFEEWWFAKSVGKPSYDVGLGTYTITNHQFKFPGIVSWSDVSLRIVDTGDITAQLMDNLGFTYVNPEQDNELAPVRTNPGGFAKEADGAINDFVIEQLSAKGDPIETWTLHSAFIKSVNFGQLAYSDDELVELELVIAYDYATLE